MSNKTDLQANNADMQQILQRVQVLPTANSWGKSTIIEPGNEVITIPAYTDKEITVNSIQTEEKTVTPSSSKQIVTPAVGKYLSKVTVGAIPSSYMDLSSIGFTKYATGFYVPSTSLNEISIAHNMGVAPQVILVNSQDNTLRMFSSIELNGKFRAYGYFSGEEVITGISMNGTSFNMGGTWYWQVDSSSSYINFSTHSVYHFKPGIRYRWITFA